MDLLTMAWVVIDFGMCVAFLFDSFKTNLPEMIQDLITWGKTRGEAKKSDLPWSRQIFLVPKRWFTHFYAFGLVWNLFVMFTFASSCFQEKRSSPDLHLVAFITGNSRTSRLDCFSMLLTFILITIQMIRRLYESLFVSSYSGSIHLGHYVIGLTFYALANLTVLAEVPVSLQQSEKNWCSDCLKPFSHISWVHLLAIFLFAWASYHQYKCHKILSEFTAFNPNGRKVYQIPVGDWFEHVSTPHYLAEIFIYIALFLAMRCMSKRWLLLLFFVTSNLVLGAKVTHRWYKEKFESYPGTRNALVPYVY